MKKMSSEARQAIDFLTHNNVLGMSQIRWFFLLTDYFDYQGDEAIQALAGAVVWARENIEDEGKRSSFLNEIIRHDFGEMKEKFMLPRSSEYLKYWLERKILTP